MERALCSLLVAFAATAWAGDGSAQLEACNEQLLDCKENCTIDYGTSVKLRTQLMKCVKKCGKKHTTCRAHTLELQQAGIEIPDEKPAKKEESARTPVEESPAIVEEKPIAKEESKPAPIAEKAEVKEEEAPPPVAEKKVEKKKDPPPAEKAPEKVPEKVEEKPKKKKALDEWDEGDIDR